MPGDLSFPGRDARPPDVLLKSADRRPDALVMTVAEASPVATGSTLDCASGSRVRIEDFTQVQDYLRAYLDDDLFRSRYPGACQRWLDAAAMLWDADSRVKVVALATEAREAMREFACALVDWSEPHAAVQESKDTVVRLSALVEMQRPRLGEDRCALQAALLEYWDALCTAVQRHGDPHQTVQELSLIHI